MGYIGAGISRFNTADELTVTGDAEFNGNANFGDSDKVSFSSGKLEMYHDGTNAYIDETYANGTFLIRGNNISLQKYTGETMIQCVSDGKVELNFNNVPKLETTSSGVDVTGGLNTTGNVGIGTDAPAHNVEIVATAAGSVNDSLQIRNNATSSGTGSRIRFINSTDNTSDTNGASISSVRNGDDNDLVFETENATRMTIDHAGKVGISNTAPDFNLSVGNSSSVNPSIQIMSATNSNAQLLFGDGAGAAGYRGTIVYGNATDSMSFSTAGAERMRIDSSGNLLVGKTASGIANNGIELRANDDVLITKDGATALYLNRKSSDGEIIEFRKDGTGVGSIGVVNNNNPFISNDADNSGLQFASTSILPHYDNLQRDNAVDLGSSSVRFKDGYFSNGITARYHYNINDPDTYIDFATNNLINYYVGGAERGRFVTTGFVVGKTSSGDISVAGAEMSTQGYGMFSHNTNIALYANRGDTGTLVWFGRAGANKGDISVSSTAVAFNTSSDRRLKSNIQNAASASDKIDAIQVRQFDWKADDSHQDYGLIAQELQPIEPMAVSGDADSDEMMAVDYSKLVPMLIKEIQELRSRVAALEE